MQPQFTQIFYPAQEPVAEDVFLAHLGEFTCLQFRRVNDLTGKETLWELVADGHSQQKAQVLAFWQTHPLRQLLDAQRIGDGFDMDRWELRILFGDTRLNRSITGYGHTEVATPYVQALLPLLPRLLSDEEQAYRELQKYRYRKK
jgi:hypothetical protein